MRPRNQLLLLLLVFIVFLGWRFIRPLDIFIISEHFERPVQTADAGEFFTSLSATACGECHPAFYAEWQTTIHSQAWTDPYFQADWEFDETKPICKNCHIPLDRQQEHLTLGFRDEEKWDPILVPNPDFDPRLQHEGVTCAACHLRAGKIRGVYGDTNAPHPVEKLTDPNTICMRCHIVEGKRWDTFFRIPPCGTVAEIQEGTARPVDLGCVECHMPRVERSLVPDGPVRTARQHLWRGGHDPEMVKSALAVEFNQAVSQTAGEQAYEIRLTNTGAAHYLPTGTPDRHLTITLRSKDADGKVLDETRHTLERNIIWRPFIIDLGDNRLRRWQPQTYRFTTTPDAFEVEAVVRYHLLGEKRRQRIGYKNQDPIAYEVFRRTLKTGNHKKPAA